MRNVLSNKFHKVKLLDIFLRIAEIENIPLSTKDGYPRTGKLADVLSVSKQSISNWKFRQTIPWEELLHYASLNRDKFSVYWLLTGEEEEPSICDVGCHDKDKELARKAVKILRSGDPYSGALTENINAFHSAVVAKEESDARMNEFMDNVQSQINTMNVVHEKIIDDMKAQHDQEVKELKTNIENLKKHQECLDNEGLTSHTGTDEEGGSQK